MRAPSKAKMFVLSSIAIVAGVWAASQWWEKALATKVSTTISPNGCYRVESFKPFWVLFDIFHPMPHPGEEAEPKWFPWWEYPGFYRLYDHRTGRLIAVSNIYDLASVSGRLYWGGKAGHEVSAGLIYIGPNAPDCIGDQPTQPPALSERE